MQATARRLSVVSATSTRRRRLIRDVRRSCAHRENACHPSTHHLGDCSRALSCGIFCLRRIRPRTLSSRAGVHSLARGFHCSRVYLVHHRASWSIYLHRLPVRHSAPIARELALASGRVWTGSGVRVGVGPVVRIVESHYKQCWCGRWLTDRHCPSQVVESGGEPCRLTKQIRCSGTFGIARRKRCTSALPVREFRDTQ
jgi:hypothetical protein